MRVRSTPRGVGATVDRRTLARFGYGRLLLCAICVCQLLVLTGCSDDGMNDLRQFVEEAKTKRGHVEPLPEFPPVETYAYTADKLKDPFASWRSEVKTAQKTGSDVSGIRPDENRRKEILENFPLDTLRMMGTLEFKKAIWGLVKAPDGIVYRVKPGNYLGQNYGKILEVQEKKIILSEIVPNGLGGWEERQAALTVNEE